MADCFNYHLAQKMQEVAEKEFVELSAHLPVGSYTASQVFEYFDTIRQNKEAELKNKKEESMENLLFPECMQQVNVEFESFKCSSPRYLFFKMLAKLERLAGIGTARRKKFIREASSVEEVDVSFTIEISKSMKELKKAVSTDELHKALNHVCLDYQRGYLVASDGHIMSVMKADFKNLSVKEGLGNIPVMMPVSTFSNCVGTLSVGMKTMGDINRKLTFATENGYYEEETCFRYPQWQSVYPKELYRNGRVSIGKDDVKRFKSFAKQAAQKGVGEILCVHVYGKIMELSYWEHDNSAQYIFINLPKEAASFTIGFKASHFKVMDGWNGTMWVTDSSRFVIFDKETDTDFYVVSPKMLPAYVNTQCDINGSKVSFDERHTEYVQAACKQRANKVQTRCKQDANKVQTKEIINPIKQVFMAAERYEGTQAFYSLSEIEDGNFPIRGAHDSELVLFLRTAAHYIRRQGELMQSEFCAHCSEQLKGKDWRSVVPMQELALAEMFESFLEKKGIEDIPDVEFDDAPEAIEAETEGNLDFVPQEEPIEEEPEVVEVEAEEVEEVEDVTEPMEATIKPMAIETEIVPILELETEEGGKLIVAGESYFHKLYDEDNGCFRSEKAEAKFDEIDAFIPDELIQAEELDYEAIGAAIEEFMEQAS